MPPDSAVGRRPRVAVIVTVFPAVTETFILRDVVGFLDLGFDVRVYHLTRYNEGEVLHDFAREVPQHARGYAYFFSPDVLSAFFGALFRRPRQFFGVVKDMLVGSRRDPVMLLKSLFILPKSVRITADLEDWQADHVHAAYAGHPATTAWVAKRLAGIPFSVSSHAHDLFETQALLPEKLPEADFVRTISQYNKRFILERIPALKDRPPIVIHVGAALDRIPILPAPAKTGPFRVLYVGSLEVRKGVDTLLRAVARANLGEWRLDVIGKGPERERLEALSAELGLGEQARFHGGKPFEEVSKALADSSVLVVPARIGPRNQTEGLPTILVEALAHRRPVIASRLTGIPEIVIDGETGLLVEVDDYEGLARSLEAVRADPDLAFARAVRGRALVEAEFDQRKNIAALAELVDASIDRRRTLVP